MPSGIDTWYTRPVTLDLAAIARATGGELTPGPLTERTPVDGVTRIEDYVVVGNHAYATLVTGSGSALLTQLAEAQDAAADRAEGAPEEPTRAWAATPGTGAARLAALRGAVYVGPDEPASREALSRAGVTAILVPEGTPDSIHPRLVALLAEDRAASDRIVTSGMQVLTQVARRGGVTAVIAELAHRIGGWAVLLDAQGRLLASAGAGRLHVSDATAFALGRPVRVRHTGMQLHQVGSDRDRAGSLVIAARTTSTSQARDLATLAATLFDLLLRTHDPSLSARLGREALLGTLLGGGEPARELLHRWEIHADTLTAFELGAKTRTIDLEHWLRGALDEMGAEHVFALERGRVRGFVRDRAAAGLAARAQAFAPIGGGLVHLGIGSPAPVDALAKSAAQARQALDSALESGAPVARYEALPTVSLVLSALDGARTEELSRLLDPLRDATGAHGELALTLRVFLAEGSAHRASAARLGIHRQTLASRIARIEDLTGLSLARADDRTAAWLAIRAAGI